MSKTTAGSNVQKQRLIRSLADDAVRAPLRVALVHDLLMTWGGAERVLSVFADLFPDAPIYTLVYDERLLRDHFPERVIHASFLQKFPRWIRMRYRWLLPLMPLAASLLPVKKYDLIVSSSSAFAKGVRRGTHAVHVCYCHAPSRFLWDDRVQYQKDNRIPAVIRLALFVLMYPMRLWDLISAERVDIWVANARTTQERIRRLYHKPSAVVYPPVPQLNGALVRGEKSGRYFLVVSRLSAFKKVDVIVDACTGIDAELVVVGVGAEEGRLRGRAGKNITFTGSISDEKLAEYYAGCAAFITACDDDFGMSAVEALSFGKPVLAYRSGGVTEWMEEGKTGEFFDAQTPDAVRECIQAFLGQKKTYDPDYCMKKAELFSEKRFRDAFVRQIPR